ncbi:uncharacterized protein LOC110269483 [Arachis ipaensis]|uniref:uncharacterized protein LOC110269483 n=1 Tax=Arachis ipaensis TaxID=130454 RepID=UPI000A2B77DE|nr:uncharacterized protein LOC110269483 [Arachis ipaensis]
MSSNGAAIATVSRGRRGSVAATESREGHVHETGERAAGRGKPCAGKPLRPKNAPAAVARKFCRYHDRNSSPLLLEVAAGLPPNRFGDRRCFGSAVPFIVSDMGAEVTKSLFNCCCDALYCFSYGLPYHRLYLVIICKRDRNCIGLCL